MIDAVIIGAGVIGAMVARTLARYPLSVLVLEKENDVMMGATKANSAIVHAGFDAKEGTLKAKLNVKGSEMMEQVAGELGVKYRKNGSLVVGFTPEDRKTLNELLERGQRNGVKGLKLLTREEILEKEPHIGDAVSSALYAPTGAIICPYELGMAALGNAMDNGVSLRTSFTVRGIEKKDGFFRITDGKEFIDAKTVVNCAGVYSDAVAEMVGDCSFSITPRRGEYMLLDKECGYLTDCTVFRCPSAMGKGILVSPTVDGNLLLGPTAENIEDKEDKKTTPAGLAEVARQAKEQVKDLPLNKVITSFSGLRAVGSTGDFILNQPVPGFFNAAGIESPGLSSAPAIGEYIAEEMKESGFLPSPKPDFNGKRESMHAFRQMSAAEKNEIIAKDPSYAKIVCRCEQITEGEIRKALRTNPRPSDLDGVKRRTRAQMGRCQGGFCSPTVAELIAEETGIPLEKVTKSGGESNILSGRTKGEEQGR